MKQYYDLIFITNLPSFYKIKLYNEIALQKKILVIYTGDTAKEETRIFLMVLLILDIIIYRGIL